MATHQATVCDFDKCRSLADNVCIVCGRDGCEPHLPSTLGLMLLGLRPETSTVPTDPRPGIKLVAEAVRYRNSSVEITDNNLYARGEGVRLCDDCATSLPSRAAISMRQYRPPSDKEVPLELEKEAIAKIDALTAAAWQQIIEILQTRNAARRLGGGG